MGYSKSKRAVIITQIEHGNERITVAVKLERGGEHLEVNEIASVHAKSVQRLISEMNTDKSDFSKDNLKYVDKEKALKWFAMEPPLGSSQTTQDLNSAAKIVKEFENPSIPGENVDGGAKFMQGKTIAGASDKELSSVGVVITNHAFSTNSKYGLFYFGGRKLSVHISDHDANPARGNNDIDVMGNISYEDLEKTIAETYINKVRGNGNSLLTDVNSVRSVYPKDHAGGVIDWINNGLLRYADKNKMVGFITQSTNLIAGNKTDAYNDVVTSAAKIVKEFENPKIFEKNVHGQTFLTIRRRSRPADWRSVCRTVSVAVCLPMMFTMSYWSIRSGRMKLII